MFKKLIRKITQQDKVDELKLSISLKDEMIESLRKDNEELVKNSNFKNTEDQRAEYWNNHFKKRAVVYTAEEKYKRDVRTYLIDKSDLLMDVLVKNNLISNDIYETIYNIEQWVIKNIRYKSDPNTGMDYWKEGEYTLQDSFGDCEDGNMLIKSLCLVAKIPDYMVKVVAGYVEDPNNEKNTVGHCYCIVLTEESKWVISDFCYFPTTLKINKRIEHKVDKRYNKPIWFTFTKEFGFADEEINIEGRIRN